MSAEKAAAVAAPDAKPEKDEDDEDAEGFSGNAEGLLAESVTKDEWKSIEASLTYNKKTVAEMLKRACGQVRHKGEILIDDSNGKFLGDMLPEMDNFSNWCVPPSVLLLLLLRLLLLLLRLRPSALHPYHHTLTRHHPNQAPPPPS